MAGLVITMLIAAIIITFYTRHRKNLKIIAGCVMKVSNYISLAEATNSDTAKRKGITNMPNEAQLEAMQYVAKHIFDPVREHIGGPVYASSFFRSPKLNKAIGGSRTSQHCKGEAIDIDCDFYGIGTNKQVFEFIKNNLEFDQLIWEFGDDNNPDWVHVSLKRQDNRRQILKAFRDVKGVTHYKAFA